MSLFQADELGFARAIARLAFCNPFVPERVALEREALGAEFVDHGLVWYGQQQRADRPVHPNVDRLNAKVDQLTCRLREAIAGGAAVSPSDRALYEDLVLYVLFNRYSRIFFELIDRPERAGRTIAFYEDFARDVALFLDGDASPGAAEHLFSVFFQIRRAFHYTFYSLMGGSAPAARLRADVWRSVFGQDMRRYIRSAYRRMGDFTTLIIGPSGTGKELVARAIGRSRYRPFDPRSQAFAGDERVDYCSLNLAALSPTLIESELFGHRRGAFTGAVDDRRGWLEVCSPLGTVFLDEIGEVSPAIQVKLLRVLESRVFQRLGDVEDRRFEGKIVAATNRDPAAAMRAGLLRPDFYYRLCSDLVATPSLAEVLADDPGELATLVRYLSGRVAGVDEAQALAEEVLAWIDDRLGPDYRWPGNVRELEQCVRNVMIRGTYHPPRVETDASAVDALVERFRRGELAADEMLTAYITRVYHDAGSYQATARRLRIDRRTVKARVDAAQLAALRGGQA